jgi:hypothetical protein
VVAGGVGDEGAVEVQARRRAAARAAVVAARWWKRGMLETTQGGATGFLGSGVAALGGGVR